MIRELAQCPYCNGCEVALDDDLTLVFNPGTGEEQPPCPHLAWIEGRYEQWEHGPHGGSRVIGSSEFDWQAPGPDAEEQTAALLPYLRELVNSGPGWPFAPAEPFTAQLLSADEKKTDPKGKIYPVWEVDGWAVFARDPAAFWAALPACQERQLAALEVPEDEQGA